LCLILAMRPAVRGQEIYSGRVLDLLSGTGINGAEIRFKGSDTATFSNSLGEFRISRSKDTLSTGEVRILDQTVFWSLPTSGVLRVFNLAGQETHHIKMNVGEGNITLRNLSDGIYIFSALLANGSSYQAKFIYNRDALHHTAVLKATAQANRVHSFPTTDTLVISKNGYYSEQYRVISAYSDYELMYASYPSSIDFLSKLIRPESFILVEGPPLNPVFSEIKSVKVVYSIKDDKLYFINSTKYFIHYEFARDVLNYKKGHSIFNMEQYTNNTNRLYILATLNLFVASGIYTLDFFAGDELDCAQIEKVYKKIVQTTYVGTKLKFYANNLKWAGCSSIPSITSDELFAGQNYQPLNPDEAYGYLRKFTLDELKTEYTGRHDIVVLNGIPNDISVVAGIITTEFQTPLSHINVLSHNRGAPNMALRDGWTNPQLESLNNKLVYLKVTLDTFILREASLADAKAFWAAKEPSEITRLRHDTLTQGLIDLTEASVESDTTIGGKASNFSELMKITVPGYGPLPLPEGVFAIPFYYYWQHMHGHSLDVYVRHMIEDPRFRTDFQYRKSQLERLQDSIKSLPIDPSLLALVNAKINASGGFTNIRFRSSTNSEDIKGFNGAGLYDSYTGVPGNPEKTIERAIKKVWASLWNLPAYEEREYFKIDQLSVNMAVLVHRSFPSEAANGVVITDNLYNPYNPGFTINVQVGEISITNPEGGYTSDQIIRYTFDDIIEYINHSNVPGMQGKTVLSDPEIKELSDYCLAIHNHYCRLNSECLPLDIEFKVDLVNGVRKIYIKQARIY
jgi:pyruvate, water dikinase